MSMLKMESTYNRLPQLDEDEIDNRSLASDVYLQREPPIEYLPRDRYNFVAVTFHLLGISVLLPFTFFVTANDYWMYKFRNESDVFPSKNVETKTELQTMFTAYLALADNITGMTISICNMYLIKRFSQEYRNGSSIVVITLLFIVTLTFTQINTDSWKIGFFSQTMVTVVILNSFAALFGGSMISLAAFFPSHILHTMVMGQALGGVVPSVASILSLVGNAYPTKSAAIYFSLALVILFVTFTCYVLIHRTEYFRYYIAKSKVCVQKPPLSHSSFADLITTFQLLWPYILAIFINFLATMSVCPGIVALEVSSGVASNTLLTGRLFLPVASFLLFSTSDFCGRLTSGWIPNAFRGRYSLLALSCAKVIFVPLLMLCNAYPRKHLPVVFRHDAYYITFMAFFGFGNGYCYSRTLLVASKNIPPRLQNDSSILLNFACELGVVLGSVITIGLIKML